jgi:hypothetical protein
MESSQAFSNETPRVGLAAAAGLERDQDDWHAEGRGHRPSLPDAEIWAITAFVKKFPNISHNDPRRRRHDERGLPDRVRSRVNRRLCKGRLRMSGVRCADNGQVRSEARYVLETPASSEGWLSTRCYVAEPGSSECSPAGFGDFYTDDFEELVGALFAINVSGQQTGSNQSVE